ncbi:hypothetical protein B296_00005095 [Ensete ventricosum]|uniref:Retrotransposon gag domain-containing protein n=1 Tax=Ensete ventricosum TaxID=4639 RepID=A0A427AZJ8_ENSVE|nr:hypothetical protein B296_00005095 [Ensete ventricosum]
MTSLGASLFASMDKPIPVSFRLPMLEAYDRSADSIEHVVAFRVQMTLYGTSNALIYRAFPTTLRGIAQMRSNRQKPHSISSFDQLVKEFESNFLASTKPKPPTMTLLELTQKDEESPSHFSSYFFIEIRIVPDAHPFMIMQANLMGL